MSAKEVLVRNATTFKEDGALDEEGFAALMQRFVDAKVGVYVGTAGSGESHALSPHEQKRIYEIAVSVCKGKVPARGNPPEKNTPDDTVAAAKIAVEAGVEIVSVYGPAGWHGFKPTDAELIDYFDYVLPQIKHPVAINPNQIMGYVPKASLLVDLCKKYSQIVEINLAAEGDHFFFTLQEKAPNIALNVPIGQASLLSMGAAGLVSAEATILPKTYRRYLDAIEAGDAVAAKDFYKQAVRFGNFVRAWGPSNARWLKMAMRLLKLPGGKGGPRRPYRMPPQEEMDKFAKGLAALAIPELDELIAAAARAS